MTHLEKGIRKKAPPLMRPRASNVKARRGGQPEHSKVVVRGIFHSRGSEVETKTATLKGA